MNEKIKWRALGRTLMLLIAGCVYAACGDDDPVPPTLTLSPTNLTFENTVGNSNEVKITTGGGDQWEITSMPEWLRANATSGTGSYTVRFTTTSENADDNPRQGTIAIKATNSDGEASASIEVTQSAADIAADCYAEPDQSAMLMMSYGMAFVVNYGDNTHYFLYNIYEESEYDKIKGSDDQIEQEATKTGTKWTRINIPSSGKVEIIKDDCQPNTRYVFTSIGYNKSGRRGRVIKTGDNLMTFDAGETTQPRVSVKLQHEIKRENHDGNDGPWYLWEVTKKGNTDRYYTYACAGPTSFETMKDYKGDFAILDEHNGIRVAWQIWLEHKSNMMEHSTKFNGSNSDVKDKLFGEFGNSDTQWLGARSSDKYLQLVVWPVDRNGNYSGIIYDVVYKVNYPNIEGVDPDPYTTATPTSLSFGPDASSQAIDVTSNETWAVSSNQSWCTVTPTSGSNSGSVNVAVTANTSNSSRSAQVTITGEKSGNRTTVNVTQDGSYLTVDKSSMSFGYSGGSDSFTISSNVSWTVTSSATWCTVSPSSGSNNGTITVTATENTTTADRTATITVTGGGITRTIAITQKSKSEFEINDYGNDSNLDGYSLAVTTTSLQFDATAATKDISLTGNDNWTATSNATSWCTVSPASGTAPSTIKVTATANNTTSSRTAIVTIKGTQSDKTFTVTVTQKGIERTLDVSPTTLQFDATAGTKNISLTGNDNWTATSNATSWCTVSPTSGTAPGTIKVTATANSGTSSRTATITIKGTYSGKTITVTVTQKGNSGFDVNPYGGDSNLDGKSLAVNTTSLQFDATAATKDISLTGNDNWTATSNATSWCTVSPASGTAPSTIKVTATANSTTSSRTATVTIKGTQSGKTFTVTVTQKGIERTLDASPTTLQFDATAGTKNISLTGNDNWTATSNATSWCTVSPTSGTAPGTIKVTATANSGTSSRTATITIKGTYSGKTISVTVTQKGNSGFDVNPYGSDSNLDGYSLATNTTSLIFDAAASTKNISLTGNDNWTATSSVSWCTLSPTSGTAPGTIKVTVQKNNSSQRTATITIKGSKSGKTLTVNLTQSAGGSTGFDREGYGSDTDLD